MTLTATVRATIAAAYLGAPTLGANRFDLADEADISLVSGVTSNKADLIYAATVTIAASGSQTFDLAGSLADAFGTVLTFVTVKAIMVRAAAANINDVIIGNGTNPFVGPFGAGAHTVAVRPGGALLFCAPGTGWTVTAATGDILKAANSAGTTGVTFDIVVVGTSA